MSTSTVRLQLVKPDPIDQMNVGDDAIRGNYGKIDTNIGCQVVTTVGTIVSPFTGCFAFETSPTPPQAQVYDGTKWNVLGNPNVEKGFQGGGSSQLVYTYSHTGGAFQKIFDCTFQAVAGRKYLVHYSGFFKFPTNLDNNLQGLMNNQFLWRQGSATQTGDAQAEVRYIPTVDSSKGLGSPVASFFEFFPNVTGQVTIGWWWTGKPTAASDVSGATIGVFSCNTTMTVTDIGV